MNVQLRSNRGSAFDNLPNSQLNGSGNMVKVLTANGAAGTQVNSITIKATGSTQLGMVRLYVYDGVTKFLFREVMVPANIQTGVVQAFSYTITNAILLQMNYELWVSTETNDGFIVIADGEDRTNCPC